MRHLLGIVIVIAFSLVLGASLLRAQDASLLSLNTGDVRKTVILVTKPGEIALELTYSKPKQEEFLKATKAGLPKAFKIALNGEVVAERTIAQPLTGHSIKIPMNSLDEAFAHSLAIMPLGRSAAPASANTAVGPVFAVSSSSISKFDVFMYSPATVWVDLTLGDKRKAEIAQLIAKNSGAAIPCSLNGKMVGTLQIPPGNVGPSARIVVTSVDQAMSITEALMGKAS